MTDQEINQAIAEACGFDLFVIVKRGFYYRPNACGYTNSIAEAWKLPRAEAKRYEMYVDRSDVNQCEKVLIQSAPTPDYCNDLNAMHEAEELLNEKQCAEYRRHLEMTMVYSSAILDRNKPGAAYMFAFHSKARKRAEAFLRTVGKWKD